MVRRSFRIGLRLGLALAVVAAVLTFVRSRRERTEDPSSLPDWSSLPAPSWPPLQKASVRPQASQPSGEPVSETAAAAATPAPAEAPAPPPEPAPAAAERLWVEPEDDVCPPSHPVKGKLSSGLFHLPGMSAYNRTRPDRCYADEMAAASDGLTRAKR